MATICGKITKNQLYDCDSPIFGGVESTLYLFNTQDADPPTRDAANPLIVTAINMKLASDGITPLTGFRFEGINRSVAPQVDLVRGDYSVRFNHIVNFIVFNNDAATKLELLKMATGEFFGVIENKFKAGDSAFEIYGLDRGLQLTAQTIRNLNDAASQGAWTLQLASVADAEEPRPPATFFVTDYAATKTALEALITPVV